MWDFAGVVTSAVEAIEGAAKNNQGAEIAAAWYRANPDTCVGAVSACLEEEVVAGACVQSEVCAGTPAAHADAMSNQFGTSLYYGHANARVKVMQKLAMLKNDLATGDLVTGTTTVADIKNDVIAHMLVPMYQGAIQAADMMDTTATAAIGLADYAAYWAIIKDKVAFDANDKAHLDALAATSSPDDLGTNNFCIVKTLLHRNLPDASKLQYIHDWVPCPNGLPAKDCPGASTTARATDVTGVRDLNATLVGVAVDLTEADLGLLKEFNCSDAVPPPSAPPTPPPPSAPPTPPPPSSPSDDPPCFPSSATVQRADGETAPLSSLSAGDSILAAAADGTLAFDAG